ncbi:protein POLR1D-like isoform X1 [Scyliorhinus canicula]|uniref:protein POLR1D-like isoform X1 n=1 Tax=Scyliorhinus canicula TaxID=7830 RepID=UPI0018F2A9FC|nr:protein POLR1D-like isoform X1 [Scyliorhinus canicula]
MEKDGELERKAVEELLTEAKRGKARAEAMGPMGWMKCPLPGANKRFLINTLKNAIPSQRQTYDRRQREEDEDLDLKEKEHRKKNHKNSFQPYKQGSKSRVKANRSPSPRKNDSKRTTKKYKGTNDY